VPVECELVCERAKYVADEQDADVAEDRATATEDANRVLSAMNADLLACYKKRIAANPQAHAFMTIDVVVGPDGRVRDVETLGGALLGEETIGCLVERITRGVFHPPRRGGTRRIVVPFSLRRVVPAADG
jgi:hypothetical protein